MRVLVVTEKCGPEETQRDGGARLVATLKRVLGSDLSIAQFGEVADAAASWHFRYPVNGGDRFHRRLANAKFIAERLGSILSGFSDVLFVHASMQFGVSHGLPSGSRFWTFPMFLTPSYAAAGELVPPEYTAAEKRALAHSHRVITPSHLERRQLLNHFGVPGDRIRIVPRGIDLGSLSPRLRSLSGPPVLCTLGSIKPQKDLRTLLDWHAGICERYPTALLRIIGPVQDSAYASAIMADVETLGLARNVEFLGHVPSSLLGHSLADVHLHLSASRVETFGRAAFETLAVGVPNVLRGTRNAATEYLSHLSCVRFVTSRASAVTAVEELLRDLARYSSAALETRGLFDDALLGRLLAAEIQGREPLAICDLSGAVVHPGVAAPSSPAVEAFRHFPRRVAFSDGDLPHLAAMLGPLGLDAEWLIARGGSLIADGHGHALDIPGLPGEGARAGTPRPTWRRAASKVHALHRLLQHTQWTGTLRMLGNGLHDDLPSPGPGGRSRGAEDGARGAQRARRDRSLLTS